MISTRGPENIMVVDRTCVPVADVCHAIITTEEVPEVSAVLPVKRSEVFECIDIFADYFGPRENDFIDIECSQDGPDVAVEAAGLSDWVYITALQMGHALDNTEDSFMKLFSLGMEKIMYDCLCDIVEGLDDYKHSGIHSIVFEAFQASYGKINAPKAKKLLRTLTPEDEDE